LKADGELSIEEASGSFNVWLENCPRQFEESKSLVDGLVSGRGVLGSFGTFPHKDL
jgi:hypothetical protein